MPFQERPRDGHRVRWNSIGGEELCALTFSEPMTLPIVGHITGKDDGSGDRAAKARVVADAP
jgi:hypothetical protein